MAREGDFYTHNLRTIAVTYSILSKENKGRKRREKAKSLEVQLCGGRLQPAGDEGPGAQHCSAQQPRKRGRGRGRGRAAVQRERVGGRAGGQETEMDGAGGGARAHEGHRHAPIPPLLLVAVLAWLAFFICGSARLQHLVCCCSRSLARSPAFRFTSGVCPGSTLR